MRDSAIDHDAVKKASGILERILTEEPEFWPYGLSVDQFDGGLYMLSKSANSKDYIGFVGWQEREEAGKTVGYYAIGVLPEYRRQGLAKAAVQKLLREKSAGVDEVRALVMSHNTPSQQLARSIPGVKLTIFEKLASIEKSAKLTADQVSLMKNILAPALGAVTAHTTFDQMADTNRTLGSTFRPDTWGDDKMRKLLAVLNLAGGAGAGLMALRGGQTAAYAAPLFLSLPVKDLAMKGIGTLHKADDLAAATQKALQQPKAGVPKSVLYGMLGLGAGALGLGAYASLQKARAAREQADAARGGRVKVTLPTKDPNDAETLLDIPIEEMNLSNALKARLSRDTRRKLYEETRKRTKRRRPQNPAAPTDKEKEDLELQKEELELYKESAAVPSPPGPGNPALRQTQQQAAANSIDTSTAANPQIMKAQQDAATASMQAQQQVAQAEQQTQQQLMDQQQGFQQEFQKSEQEKQQVLQENQILKLQLEKAKVEADVVKAKMQAEKELLELQGDVSNNASARGNEQLNQLIGSRLKRVSNNITKEATAGPWNIEVDTKRNPAPIGTLDPVTGKRVGGHEINPVTGKQSKPPLKTLADNTSQQMNDHGMEFMASGQLPGIHMFRTSYGSLGDSVFENFFRPYLYQPPKKAPGILGDFRQVANEMLLQPRF